MAGIMEGGAWGEGESFRKEDNLVSQVLRLRSHLLGCISFISLLFSFPIVLSLLVFAFARVAV
jgi:hypothetical protein